MKVFSYKLLLTVFVLGVFYSVSRGQDNIRFVTYGPAASVTEGDDNFRQVFFVSLPESDSGKVYIKIFDPDCGNDYDTPFGGYDTETEFIVRGDSGVYNPYADFGNEPVSGNVLAEYRTAENYNVNNKWITIAEVNATDGERLNGKLWFTVEAAGVSGDDANVFDIAAVYNKNENMTSDGITITTFRPTVRLMQHEIFGSLRFETGDAAQVTVHDFDLGESKTVLNTPFRTFNFDSYSGQGNWNEQTFALDPWEQNVMCEIAFGSGAEVPNDATFYITDSDADPLPFILPFPVGELNQRPEISVEVLPVADCYSMVFDAGASSDPDGDLLTFTWEFGDGETGTGSRVVHRYENRTFYNARLTLKDNSGEIAGSAVKNIQVTVNAGPVAVAGNDVTAAPKEEITFDGSASSDADGEIISYRWDLGDGSTAEGKTVTHSYVQPGRYTVNLNVKDNSGSPCDFAEDQLSVYINSKPTASAGEEIIVSANEEFNFDGSGSTDRDGSIVSYLWSTGTGNTLSGVSPPYSFGAPGTYKVQLVITDNAGAINSSDTSYVNVFVNNPPVAEAGENRAAAVAEPVVFSAALSSDSDGLIKNYRWDFGDGGTGTGQTATYAFAKPGRYTVKLFIEDNSGTGTAGAKDSLLVVVNDPPVANAGEDVVTTGSTINFDGSGSQDPDGEIIDYLWEFGDGTTGKGRTVTHTFPATGKYNVKLTVTDNSGTKSQKDDDGLTVLINKKPIADAGPDIVSSPGENFLLDASGSYDPDGEISEYIWEFNDGTRQSGKQVNYSFDTPGDYSVSLTVKDNSGHEEAVDFDAVTVFVNASPVASAGADIYIAPGDTATLDASGSFDDDGSIDYYEWILGDEVITGQPRITKVYNEPGFYYAELKVKDNNKASNSFTEDTVVIFVNNMPVADAGKDIYTCETNVPFDGSASSDADGDALVYTWDFGDGSSKITGKQVRHYYEKPGAYPVILTVDDGRGLKNSVSSASITVFINEAPIADAGESRVVCAGDNTIFNAGGSVDPEGGLLFYKWDFGDGTTAEGINPTKIYKEGGVYQVSLTVEDESGLECNTDIDKITITVVESPVAEAGEDKTVCANSEVHFDGTNSKDYDGVVNNYYWDFGDGTSGGGPNPAHIYDKAGTYTVTLTITGDITEGCDNTDSDRLKVTVVDAPAAQFTAREEAPVNMPVTFDGSESLGKNADITGYYWDFGDSATAEGAVAKHAFAKSGKYIVSLEIRTASDTKCNIATLQKTILINDAPVADAGEDIFTAAGIFTEFDGTASYDPDGSISSYEWNFGDGGTSDRVNPSHKYLSAGTYDVILKVTDNTSLENNTDYDTVRVVVNSAPSVEIVSDENYFTTEDAELTARNANGYTGEIKSYSWDFGDGTKVSGKDAEHKFRVPGRYNVKLTVNDEKGLPNSVTTVSRIVNVYPVPDAVIKGAGNTCPGVALPLTADKRNFTGNAEYEWLVNGASIATGPVFDYIPPGAGKRTVTLRVNSYGRYFDSDSVVINANSTPVPVIKVEGDTKLGGANTEIIFDASGSTDADRDNLRFTWDFGDGTTSAGLKVTHVYTEPGTYTVTLTADDGSGTSCSKAVASRDVTIGNK